MRKYIIFVFLLAFGSLNSISVAQSSLRFEKEDLTFEIRDSVFIVEGIYYLNADVEREYVLAYPFPVDSLLYSDPYDLIVININQGDTVLVDAFPNKFYVGFKTKISGETPVYISYKQNLKANKARYILMTTHFWGEPFKRAEYKLITDKNLNINSYSIIPNAERCINDKKLYIWVLEDFMPASDFIIEFD